MSDDSCAPSICLLGPPIAHRDSLLAALRTFTPNVAWLPDLASFLRGSGRRRSTSRRFCDLAFGLRDGAYRALVNSEIERTKPSLVMAYWGTLPLVEIKMLRRYHPELKVVLVMLCYPLGLSAGEIARQHFALRSVADSIDVIICPTMDMSSYLRANVFGKRSPYLAEIAPYWPRSYLARARSSPAMNSPNIVFAGRTDLHSRNAQKGDDVRRQLDEIMGAGIDIFHASSQTPFPPDPRRHLFPPLEIKELIEVMGRYDASLMIYNREDCRRKERFDLTVPDRLISSVAAGVPIAISRAGYTASRNYLRSYRAVIEFADWTDLSRQLSDREKLSAMKDAAWQDRERYTAEGSGEDYKCLDETIL